MPDTTTIQSLPLIQPSQAQKHVTHNEALKILDVLTQLSVLNRNLAAPPASPVLGQAHIVGAAATGAWVGQTGKVAVWYGIAWEFYAPLKGWQAYVMGEGALAVYTGTAWATPAESPAVFSQLGVSTSPDATNRLAVSSPATLFNNAGAGHQMKINKAASGDTASVLFQTGFSGRAEMGTSGTDDFAIKVSPDGSSFTEALALDRSSGRTKVQKGLRLTPAAGDLAGPVDGEVWYDSTAAKFRARQNGANVDVIPSASAGTFADTVFTLQDDGDATKQAKFQLSGLSPATTRTVTLPNATGTMVLADAVQTLTNKTINLAANTVTGTLAASAVAMTGGGTAQEYAGFSTRAGFVSWASGKTPPVGTVIDAGGYAYRYTGAGTAISDLPAWVPVGLTYPDHFAQNVTPGTTDMQAAMVAALAYSATVYLAGGVYAVGSTLAWDNSTLIGNNDRGLSRTRIQGLAATMPVASAIVAPGRSSTIRAIQIGFDSLTGTETQDQRVGLDCRGLTQALQRGSVIDEVVFDNVGTAISDYGSGEFSVTYGTLEIVRHSYRAVDIRGPLRTGSVWLNTYINGGTSYVPEGGFCMTGQCAGGMIGQLNVEHGAYTGYPVRLEGLQGLVINSLHLEGVDCATSGFGYVGLDSASVTIHSANILNTRMSNDNTAVIRLARAGYQAASVSPLLTTMNPVSHLTIGKLHVKGLATPNSTIYPAYPVGRTGVRNCAGFAVFKRDTSYTDSNWLVEVQHYLWSAYTAQAADRGYLEFADTTYGGVIQMRRLGERGSNVVAYDNYVLNGAFDKWLAATATVTAGAAEVANKWTLRGATGSVTADRVLDAYGATGQYDARLTVAAGTAQSLDQDVAFPVEWLGQALRLSFDMKAATAGRVLEQVTASLLNNGGGSPASVVKQVISGTDPRLDATTGFKTYVLDFTGVDPSLITTLGTAAVMRLSFQFNDTIASRSPVVTLRNVALSRMAGVKFARSAYDRLAIAAGDVAGLGALATASSVSLTTQATGILQAAQAAALTGDVTSTAGALATTIAGGAVSLSKMATLAGSTLIGNNGGAAATPVALTAAQVKALLAIAASDVAGLGALATASSVSLTTQATGTLQAAQEPAHTGDVTNTAGSLALTIAGGAVSLSKMAALAGSTLIGNNTGAAATPVALTAAQVKVLLAIAASDVAGLGALATASSVSLTTQATGTLQAAQEPAHTGDVTNTAGSLALTIAGGAVSLSKMATLAGSTIIGNNGGAAATPVAMTAAQVKALLAIAAADVAGLGALATASSVSLTTQATGVLQAAQEPAHTGDVTNTAGSLALTIAGGAVTLSKMATLAGSTLIGNNTGAAATPVALTAAQVKTLLAIAASDVAGLGALASASSVSLTTQATGVLQAAQAAALTGDVTSTAGALATTIAAGAVSLGKMATLAGSTLIGNNTGSAATPVALTAAQVKALLAIATADVAGLGALATASSVSLTTQATGTLQAAQEPAHTGDVTNTAGSLALTIAANVVDNTRLAQVATARFKGRASVGTGNVEDLTGTQATALLDAFTSTAKGLVPASGGGAANFLRADGSFAVPGAAGSTTQVQFNNAGVAAGASEVLVETSQLRLAQGSSFATPASGGTRLVGRADAGRTVPAFLSQDGVLRDLQTALTRSSPLIWKAQAGSGTLTALGGVAPTAVGTASAAGIAVTNLHSMTPKLEYLVTVAATTAIAGFRATSLQVAVGSATAGLGGFHFVGRWGPATGVATTTNRAFFGLGSTTAAPTDVEPSTMVSSLFMGWDAADTNVQMMTNDGTGICTKVDLGAAFPVPVTDRTALYELALYSPKGTTQSVAWLVTDLVSGATASGTFTTDLPTTATLLAPRGWISVGGTLAVIGLGLNSIYLDPLL